MSKQNDPFQERDDRELRLAKSQAPGHVNVVDGRAYEVIDGVTWPKEMLDSAKPQTYNHEH